MLKGIEMGGQARFSFSEPSNSTAMSCWRPSECSSTVLSIASIESPNKAPISSRDLSRVYRVRNVNYCLKQGIFFCHWGHINHSPLGSIARLQRIWPK